MNNKRRALIVGIDDYGFAPLEGCVKDATSICQALKTHDNDDENFSCRLLISSKQKITQALFIKEIENLFNKEGDIALLYFSGHGGLSIRGGTLVTQDAVKYNEGVDLSTIITMANKANEVREIFIILDSCHSGHIANFDMAGEQTAILRKGISILTASKYDEYAVELNGHGLFTSIVLEALNGGAADIMGNVTSASIYNYADKILGPWDQRPVFKTHISELSTLRKCKPIVSDSLLKKIPRYFLTQDYEFPLDKSFEPNAEPKNLENEEIFADLQQLTTASLVTPTGEKHMYFAAINSKACKLTPQGKWHWKISKNKE